MPLHFKPNKTSRFATVLAVALTIAAIATTAIALIGYVGWSHYLELLSHLKPQYWVATALLLLGLILTRQRIPIWIGLFCFAITSTTVIPWYLPDLGNLPAAASSFRLLTVNVNINNPQFDDVLALIQDEQPDIAVLQEMNDTWLEQLRSLEAEYPYQVGNAAFENRGIMVYSRLPLKNVVVDVFEDAENPTVLADLVVEGQPITFIATHPYPPVERRRFLMRNRQLELLGDYIQTLTLPVLLVGDLNITMWSPYYRRLVQRTGLENVRQGFGILPSWPANAIDIPIPPALTWLFWIPIDHCLVSPTIQTLGAWTGPYVGSDHLPLVVDLGLAEG